MRGASPDEFPLRRAERQEIAGVVEQNGAAVDRPQRPAATDRAYAEGLAGELGCDVLDTWLPKVERRRELADLPIDAVAYVEGVDAGVVGRAPVRPVGAYRVIYPFAEAGLSSRDIARVACAFGLVTDELAAVGSASSR